MPRKVREITDLEIDEISLVDKGAYQHAKVTIAKSEDGEKENHMEIYDEEGSLLDPESLEDGDVVYDDEGNGYLFEMDDESDYDDDDEYAEDGELELVGKAASTGAYKVARAIGRRPMQGPKEALVGTAKYRNRAALGLRPMQGPARPPLPNVAPSTAAESASAFGAGSTRMKASSALQGAFGSGRSARRRKIGAGIGAGGVALGGGGAVGYHEGRVKKNYSQELRVELSKALTDRDRDNVIAKAFGQLDELTEAAQAAEEIAMFERSARLEREYVEVAKSYNLPIQDEVLAGVLMRAAEALPYEDCEIIGKCLEAASEAIFYEVGSNGGGANSDVYAQVEEYANSQVSKSADRYGATSEVFSQNPELYEEYLREQR
jgi:hypothetical protein